MTIIVDEEVPLAPYSPGAETQGQGSNLNSINRIIKNMNNTQNNII